MARNTGQIVRLGDGRWRVRWYKGEENGRRLYGSKNVRGTKKKAEAALRDALNRQDRGIATPSPSRVPRLRDQVEAWKGTQKAKALRDSTRRDYLKILDRHVLPELGGLRLDAIHTATIEKEVVGPLLERGCNRTAQLAVAALSGVFRSALKDPTLGLVGNPCRGVTVGRGKRREIRPLSASERGAFREAIRGTEPEPLWLLMMLTGLGPGEALGLGWEHLDLEAGELRVRRTLDTEVRVLVDDTKRPSRRRTVPLVPELRAILRERWLQAGRPAEGLVFADRLGRPLDFHKLRARHFRDALERAGIKRRVTPYALRHGFATAALEAGVDVKTVSDLMGHNSTHMVQNVYQHVSDDRRREAGVRIGEALLGG
jgi:integrase